MSMVRYSGRAAASTLPRALQIPALGHPFPTVSGPGLQSRSILRRQAECLQPCGKRRNPLGKCQFPRNRRINAKALIRFSPLPSDCIPYEREGNRMARPAQPTQGQTAGVSYQSYRKTSPVLCSPRAVQPPAQQGGWGWGGARATPSIFPPLPRKLNPGQARVCWGAGW